MKLDAALPSHLLVTGGGGFVGGNFTRLALRSRPLWRITVLDHLGGRETPSVLEGLDGLHPGRFRLVRSGLEDAEALAGIFEGDPVQAVVHFAAKNPSGAGHQAPLEFARVNVVGTGAMLEAARKAGGMRFLHLSSYEVYGSHPDGLFTERTPLTPTTPYAASKAAADTLTLAYHRTFKTDALVSRTTNIYGPFQSGDKLIPFLASRAFRDEPLPVYGSGAQTRDWIHVDDHNRGVLAVLERGRAGEVYHIGARCERTNLEVALAVADAAAEVRGLAPGSLRGLVSHVEDRKAHDPRRTLDTAKSERELELRPEIPFDEGLRRTVEGFYRAGREEVEG